MKRFNFKVIIPGIFVITTMVCCNLIKECPKCFTPPEPLRFRLISKVDSTDLITSGFFHKDSIHLYYYDQTYRKDVDLMVYTDSVTHKSTIFSNEIAWASVSGFKDFYLTLNSKVTDTLYLNVIKKEEDCCAYHQYISFKYNGQVIQIDQRDYVYYVKK